jgi:hypothetical protein
LERNKKTYINRIRNYDTRTGQREVEGTSPKNGWGPQMTEERPEQANE